MSERTDTRQPTKWDDARDLLAATGEISLGDLSQYSATERESVRLALDELDDLGIVAGTDEQTWALVSAV